MTGTSPRTDYYGIHKKISSPEKVFPIHFQVRGRSERTPDVSEDMNSVTIVDRQFFEKCAKDRNKHRGKVISISYRIQNVKREQKFQNC